jgi:Holliday junction DNA helicase RuvA
MYDYFKGSLTDANHFSATIECGGIGYKLSIPLSTLGKLPPIGSTTILYTSFVIRENSQALYGFLSRQERELFEILITMNGVGPKTALSLIGHLSIEELEKAVLEGNLTKLTKVPGIGKKTAERLLLDLKDKSKALFHRDLSLGVDSPHRQSLPSIAQDAINALLNLGYNGSGAQKAVEKIMKEEGDDLDLSKMITLALKQLSQK